jgi:hypothetical protein
LPWATRTSANGDAKLLCRGVQTLRFTDFRIEYDIADCLDDVRAVMRLSPGTDG